MFQEFKKIFKHFFIYGFGNIANKLISIIMIPIYTRFLNPDDYGRLELIFLTTTVISTFVAMGISSAALRFYFEYDDKRDRREVIGTALITSIIVSLCVVLILSHFAGFFSTIILDSIDYRNIFIMVFLIMFFYVTEEIPLAYIRANEKSVLFVIVSFAKLLFLLTLNIYFVVILKKGIWGIVISNLIVSILSWTFLIVFTFNYSRLNFSFTKLKEMLRYGLPLTTVAFGMFILNSSDRFFLKKFASLEEVGLYALGYKFAIILNFLIIQPFMTNYSPYRFSIMKRPDAKEIYSRVLTYFLFIIISAGLIISVMIKEILAILVAPSYLSAYKIVFPVIVGYIFLGAYFICQIGIYLQKQTKRISGILLFCASFNLIMNWLLISKFHMYGAALSTVLSFALLALITNYHSQRLYRISYERDRIIKLIITACGIYLLSLFIVFDSLTLNIILKALLLTLFPITLYYINFFRSEEIHKLQEGIIKLKELITNKIVLQKF